MDVWKLISVQKAGRTGDVYSREKRFCGYSALRATSELTLWLGPAPASLVPILREQVAEHENSMHFKMNLMSPHILYPLLHCCSFLCTNAQNTLQPAWTFLFTVAVEYYTVPRLSTCQLGNVIFLGAVWTMYILQQPEGIRTRWDERPHMMYRYITVFVININ